MSGLPRRDSLASLQDDSNQKLRDLSGNANSLAQQVADLNAQVAESEGGTTGSANALRDQRDAVLKQLSQLADIKTVPGDSGAINVYIGSEPLVINALNRGVALRQDSVNGELANTVTFKTNNGTMKLDSGKATVVY